MNTWSQDILTWLNKKGASPSRFTAVENILLRNGWEPQLYQPQMRKALHSWLNDWYYLSKKVLPLPATSSHEEVHLKYKNYISVCGRPIPNKDLVIDLDLVTCEECLEEG